ncbi:MAG: xylulokinase [Oenococcus oeni]
MTVVLGVDLGTSAVKVSAVNKAGKIVAQESFDYPLVPQSKPGYAEQNPEDWVIATTVSIVRLILNDGINASQIEGISFSGQMHGLVLLDENYKVLRPAILWNDTRTSDQVLEINRKLGAKFVEITGNKALEGFTLPKILWVKENEPEIFSRVKVFLLPKDYLRFRMTDKIFTDFSDAAGTVALNVRKKIWSKEVIDAFGLPQSIFPPLLESIAFAGNISNSYSEFSGLSKQTKVFAGAADNAAGAIGAGILKTNMVMSSIGTSGVVLKIEQDKNINYHGEIHFFNHGIPNRFYSMGVTLAAGYSLSWLKNTFGKADNFDDFVKSASNSTVGAKGLMFTPYIVGERTPYSDGDIRGSFVGIDGIHQRSDFVRAVLEGIVFSFKDIFVLYDQIGANFDTVVSIGGGAKSPLWMQIQADIFNKKVISLKNEQGPGIGAAIIAATGLGWFDSVEEAAKQFISFGKEYQPNPKNVVRYENLYKIYKQIYPATAKISHELIDYRRSL